MYELAASLFNIKQLHWFFDCDTQCVMCVTHHALHCNISAQQLYFKQERQRKTKQRFLTMVFDDRGFMPLKFFELGWLKIPSSPGLSWPSLLQQSQDWHFVAFTLLHKLLSSVVSTLKAWNPGTCITVLRLHEKTVIFFALQKTVMLNLLSLNYGIICSHYARCVIGRLSLRRKMS